MRGSKMVGCAIVVALAATACGGGGSDDEGKGSSGGGGFSMNIAEPKRLVPQSTTESGGSQVLSGLFTPLVDFDAKNQPVLAAAESIESPDNKVWTVKLKDATWHDGKPVTAKDYVGAWNWGAYGPNAADGNYFFGTIQGYDEMNPVDPDGEEGPKKAEEPKAKELSGLKVIDDKTFEITLKAPVRRLQVRPGLHGLLPDARVGALRPQGVRGSPDRPGSVPDGRQVEPRQVREGQGLPGLQAR
ncbi:ABC transporter substrate-binding protein [Streptomyces sp. CYG20]|uniref:peptide ABC transporter substrate-binding protein n=1 Tax=Streptomyces sp. CYG20 TaxID=2838873 RepID=UPI0027E4225D|nr:ABC transporter substrate-binding protein [Streptomyces sp. CYG20]